MSEDKRNRTSSDAFRLHRRLRLQLKIGRNPLSPCSSRAYETLWKTLYMSLWPSLLPWLLSDW